LLLTIQVVKLQSLSESDTHPGRLDFLVVYVTRELACSTMYFVIFMAAMTYTSFVWLVHLIVVLCVQLCRHWVLYLFTYVGTGHFVSVLANIHTLDASWKSYFALIWYCSTSFQSASGKYSATSYRVAAATDATTELWRS